MTADIPPAPSADHSGTSGPATRVKSSASAASQFAYPLGHLGHLSEREEVALDKLKALLEEGGLWTRGPPASHDDQTLLRYLRARRWVPEDAYRQFKDTEDWRASNQIDTLYRTIELEAYEQSRRLYPQWTGRRDRRGTPLFVFDVKKLDHKTVSEYEKQGAKTNVSDARTDGKTPPGLLRLFALYENLTRFTQPFCTQLLDRDHAEVPITMSTNIVDITGVGLKQFWNLKSHMQSASQLATAHYPETLDMIFIIGAPLFFSTVWGWVRRWFDPITVSKIHVLGPHEVKSVLERYIDPSNIPKKYGGGLDYSFGQMPKADPAWEGVVAWEKGVSSFPTGPLLWEEEEEEDEQRGQGGGGEGEGQHGGKRLVCVATGKEKGKPRRQRICTVRKAWPPGREQAVPRGQSTSSQADVDADVEHTKSNEEEGNVSEGTQTSAQTYTEVAHPDEALTNGQLIDKLQLEENTENDVRVAPAAAATTA
ncbi:hypothetical protein E4U09_008058 [Claviceps aff. purpurea]|uniref:CRAL-TRIO domain-containing protein n=1 Tax=Claviceps aff. purpurea TaxID=1967640 RepID=A0A9P7U3A4_9HYPO|nr:hypothetical protein E4U09_008058 [Claviceps aff. purpurea]